MRSTKAQIRSVSSMISRGQFSVLDFAGLLQELRRATDAGKRVLDLVRQHKRHCADGPRGTAMCERAVDAVGD